MAKVDRVAAVITELAGFRASGPDDTKKARLKALLGDKQSYVVAKAVDLVGQWGLKELLPELLRAFERHFEASDLGCEVKTSIAKVLVDFEVDRDSEAMPLILRGLPHIQHEKVWGDPPFVDVAAALRGWCAMAIAASGHREQIRLILPLLVDPEVQARVMAIRSLSISGSDAAEAVIRFKLLVGDKEDEVVGECLTALGAMWPEGSMGILKSALEDSRLRPLAALALGECRHPEALPILKTAYQRESFPDRQRDLLAGLVLSRREEASQFLIGQIGSSTASQAIAIIEALAPRRQYGGLWEKITAAVKARGDAKIIAALARSERS